MAFSTFYDLLQEGKEKKLLGKKCHLSVSELPSDEFKNYVIKSGTNHFSRSTILTPLDYGLRMNLGQPRLVDANHAQNAKHILTLGVLLKVPGEDLNSLRNAKVAQLEPSEGFTEACRKAVVAVTEIIAGLPNFSFEQWMLGKRHQLELGLGGDNHTGNIMYAEDSKRLYDIDVVEYGSGKWPQNHTKKVLAELDIGHINPAEAPILHKRKTAAMRIIEEKILTAAKFADVPRDESYFIGKKPPVFKRTDLTHYLGEFKVSEAPEKLLAMLKEMEHHYPIRL